MMTFEVLFTAAPEFLVSEVAAAMQGRHNENNL
jgi:hypothetical protein